MIAQPGGVVKTWPVTSFSEQIQLVRLPGWRALEAGGVKDAKDAKNASFFRISPLPAPSTVTAYNKTTYVDTDIAHMDI